MSSHFFSFYCSRDHRDLHSFPTRRSSDLGNQIAAEDAARPAVDDHEIEHLATRKEAHTPLPDLPHQRLIGRSRSEEHTSELQSRQYLVCRLLLEKKKKKTTTNRNK